MRRNNIDQLVPAEKAIRDALLEVEKLPAHQKLTEATIKLSEAWNLVSDFVDANDTGGSNPPPDKKRDDEGEG